MAPRPLRATRLRTALAFALAAVPVAPGCATTGPSAEHAIATARFAIRDARVDGAGEYAPAQLEQAEAYLGSAQATDGIEAARLAEKATVHAQMADAIAAREAARAKTAELRRLQEEVGAVRDMTTEAAEERTR